MKCSHGGGETFCSNCQYAGDEIRILTPPTASGVKHDFGKPPIGLLSAVWLFGVAKVLAFGADRYGKHNWRGGMDTSRIINAVLRHMLAWNSGEDVDPDSGISHLYHASAGLMFLSEQMVTKPHLDDRYKIETPKSKD